jgi:hypothetical protein
MAGVVVAVVAAGACGSPGPSTPSGTTTAATPTNQVPTSPVRPLSSQPVAGDGGLQCPASISDVDGMTVPSLPEGLDGNARLLPDRRPVSLVVCRYPVLDVEAGPLPVPYALAGRTLLTGSPRAELAETLAWAPRGSTKGKVCTEIGGDETVHLVGAAYGDAIVWVAAKADPNACAGATNGDFDSRAAMGVVVDAVAAGRQPVRVATGGCDTQTLGRLGDDASLAPEGEPTVTVCRRNAAGSQQSTPLNADQSRQVVAALRALRVHHPSGTCEGGALGDMGRDFRLVLAYAAGPDSVVNVVDGCLPPVLGDGVAADDSTALVALVERWSKPIAGPDPNAPVSSDASTN